MCGIWQTAAPKLPELKAKMVEYAKQHSSEVGEGLEILPGVLPLLDALSRRNDVIIGLVHTLWILWPAKNIYIYNALPIPASSFSTSVFFDDIAMCR